MKYKPKYYQNKYLTQAKCLYYQSTQQTMANKNKSNKVRLNTERLQHSNFEGKVVRNINI